MLHPDGGSIKFSIGLPSGLVIGVPSGFHRGGTEGRPIKIAAETLDVPCLMAGFPRIALTTG